MEKFRPVITPYHYKWSGVKKTKYVARCGVCGNTITQDTSKRFCMYCKNNIDWTGAPWHTRYILTERALERTYYNT